MIDSYEMMGNNSPPEKSADRSDPHSLEYRGFTSVKKEKRESILEPCINNFMVPFHVIILQEILAKQTDCLGLFTVRDFMKLS